MGMSVRIKSQPGEVPVDEQTWKVLDSLWYVDDGHVDGTGNYQYLLHELMPESMPLHDYGSTDTLVKEFDAPPQRRSFTALTDYRCAVAAPILDAFLHCLLRREAIDKAADAIIGKRDWTSVAKTHNVHGAPSQETREWVLLALCQIQEIIDLCNRYPDAYLDVG